MQRFKSDPSPKHTTVAPGHTYLDASVQVVHVAEVLNRRCVHSRLARRSDQGEEKGDTVNWKLFSKVLCMQSTRRK